MALSERAKAQTANERMAPLKLLRDQPGSLLVHEIYSSLQGEGSRAGLPCTFVRLTGCHLRCHYCDTEASFDGGAPMTVDQVISQVQNLNVPLVQLTGGEPLLQKSVYPLMEKLCDVNLDVLLETSGAISIRQVDDRVIVILDIKTPSSGESARNNLENLSLLRSKDELKFVIGTKEDYCFAQEFLDENHLLEKSHEKPTILFSPESGSLAPVQLAEWILKDGLNVRFQLQMHKVLWGNKSGV